MRRGIFPKNKFVCKTEKIDVSAYNCASRSLRKADLVRFQDFSLPHLWEGGGVRGGADPSDCKGLRPSWALLLGVCESLRAVCELGGYNHRPGYICLECIISLEIYHLSADILSVQKYTACGEGNSIRHA